MTIVLQAFFLIVTVFAAMLSGQNAWPQSAVEDHAVTIVIRPAVNLDAGTESELTLAEIVDPATIAAADREAVMRHLRSIVLTDRPHVGEERTFTEAGLEAIVGEATRRLEAAGFAVEWKIPRRTSVSRKISFSRESAMTQLQEEFKTKCGGCDVVMKQIDWPVTEGLKVVSWRLAFRPDRPRGSFSVPVEFEVAPASASENGLAKRTLLISGQVEFFAQVPVAQRIIQSGEKMQPSDFKTERRNVTYILDASATARDFEESVAARGLPMGEPIWKSSLRREQQIKFGDPVRVQSGGETWSVTTDGISQGAAALGESVRVKIGKSQKLVSGILKEKGLVEIQ
jgi:flagella basal body P-ring formation protein FlgA